MSNIWETIKLRSFGRNAMEEREIVSRVRGFDASSYRKRMTHTEKEAGGATGRGNIPQQHGAVYTSKEQQRDRDAARERVRDRASSL